MSEITTTTESATPASTGEIASQALDHLEASEGSTSTESTGDGSMPTPQAETPAAPPPEPELSAAAKFLLSQGHKASKVDGRPNWLPVKSVEGMLDRYLSEHKTGWETERSTFESRVKDYEGRFGKIEPILALLDQGPEAFNAEAAKHDPRFKAYIEARPPAAAAAPMEFPGPDGQMPDGTRFYSVKGIQEQIIPYILAQAEARAEAKAQAALKPLTEREEAAKFEAQVAQRASSQAAEARTWPGFKEHEDAILKVLQDDTAKAQAAGQRPSLSLEAAYRQVVVSKLIQDDAAKRAALLKEIDATNKATPAVPRSGGETPKETGRQTTQSIAARALAKLEGA